MIWKRVKLAVWFVAVVCACVGGASLVRPYSTIVRPNESAKYVVNLDHGNLRVARVDADLAAPRLAEYAFDVDISRWPEGTSEFEIIDGTRHLTDETEAIDRELSVTLFLPLIVLLAVWCFIVLPIRHRDLVGPCAVEMVRPSSDPGTVMSQLRRVTLGLLAFLAIFTGTLWIISYSGLPGLRSRYMLSSSVGDGVILVGRHDDSSLDFWGAGLHSGKASLVMYHYVNKDAHLPESEYEFVGFRLSRGFAEPFGICGASGGSLTAEQERILQTSTRYRHIIIVPIGPFCAMTALWPVIAFIRGPLRRAKRNMRGVCLSCGYNLTGLVEPRCPECGTTTIPDRIPDVSTAASDQA